jgi:uncharacterized protein (AIM24 family)
MSGFKESAGTMTLYFKMNRYLRMMLQHGLFHLHIIVIVLEEEVVEVVVKTNEKVVAEAEVVVRMNAEAVAEVVVRTNEMLVAEVVAEAVLLIKTKKEVAEVVEIVD